MPSIRFEDLAEVIRLQLGGPAVRRSDRLVEDRGAVSMDLMRIAVAVEDRFGVFVEETDLANCTTAADLHQAVLRARDDAP